MGRPRNSLNVTDVERDKIRRLYLEGVRVAEIARRIGRGESVVYRTVCGMKSPRPAPKLSAKVARRNRMIVQRVVQEGIPQAVVARRSRLSPTMVCQIVREALGLRPSSRKQPKLPKRKQCRAKRDQPRATRPWEELTRAQWTARERYIEQLVTNGACLKSVGRRYRVSVSTVGRIVERVRERQGRM